MAGFRRCARPLCLVVAHENILANLNVVKEEEEYRVDGRQAAVCVYSVVVVFW